MRSEQQGRNLFSLRFSLLLRTLFSANKQAVSASLNCESVFSGFDRSIVSDDTVDRIEGRLHDGDAVVARSERGAGVSVGTSSVRRQ